MTNLEREIKKYNIASLTLVRGSGSVHDGHNQRCLWDICGKPMVQWSLETAKASRYINKVVLSCEDPKILDVGRKLGGISIIPRVLTTVFDRPRDYNSGIFQRELPRSLFSGEPSVYTDYQEYCIYYLKEYESYSPHILINIPANEPLGKVESLDKLIEVFFLDKEAAHGLCFYPVMPYLYIINPVTKRPFPIFFSNGLDRQYYPPLYRPGSFTIFGNPSRISGDHSKLTYIIISPEEGIDIHSKDDLVLANYYMKYRLEKEKKL